MTEKDIVPKMSTKISLNMSKIGQTTGSRLASVLSSITKMNQLKFDQRQEVELSVKVIFTAKK